MKSFFAQFLSKGDVNSPDRCGIDPGVTDLLALLRRERPDLGEAVDQATTYVVYKHSPWCGVSHRAEGEVARFRTAEPGIPVVQVDVIHEARLSAAIEAASQVRHESPQAILVHHGRVAWHDSHGRVTAVQLQRAVQALPPDSDI